MTNTQLKSQIDLAITNKNLAATISPTDVGNNMKSVVDYIDQQDALTIHLAGTEVITGSKTFTTPLTGNSITVNNSTTGFNGILVNNSNIASGFKVVNTGGGEGFTVLNTSGTGIGITNNDLSPGISVSNTAGGSALDIINNVGTGMFIYTSGAGTSIDVTSTAGTGMQITAGGAGTAIHIDGTGGPAKGIIINNSNSNLGNPFEYQKNSVAKIVMNDTGNISAASFIKNVNLPGQLLKADGTTTVGYKVYTALLTQSTTVAPVDTVLENSTGATMSWSYIGVGQYRMTASTPTFTVSKTAISHNLNTVGAYVFGSNIICEVFSTTICNVYTDNGIAFTNAILNGAFFEVRIYN